jgi:hypothetical protein
MDLTLCHALADYVLVLTLVLAGLCLVVAPPLPALACLKRQESTLIEVRQGGPALAVAAIERLGRQGRHQKLGILLSIALYPLLVSTGMNYLMADGVLIILLTLLGCLNSAPRLVPTDRDADIVALALQ